MSHEVGSSSPTTVRHATPADAPAIAELMAELGYPVRIAAIEARVARARPEGPDAVLLVEHQGRAAGVAGLHLIPLFHRDGFLARITTFVVASDVRRRGVGTALLTACERWAAERQAERVEITSGDARDDAHAFYEKSRFTREGQRFSKWVRG